MTPARTMDNSLNREILKLAIPSIIANITVPMVGMVAIAVVGHIHDDSLYSTATLIGGISIGSTIFSLLYWNFSFLRTGTGGLTAQAYGRGDSRECANLLTRALAIALGSATAILAIQYLVVRFALMLLDASPEVEYLAESYFRVRIWAAPATLSLMAIKGWFIGMQDGVSPMLTDVVVNGVCIVLCLALALGIHIGPLDYAGMGFIGVAYATLVAQYCGLALAVILLAAKYRYVFEGFGTKEAVASFQGGEIRKFFSTNVDLFVRSVCFMGIYIGFTAISATFGDLTLATGTIMMDLMLLFSYITDGFAYAGEAMVGKYIGAHDPARMRRTTRYVFGWSMGIAALFMVAYHLWGDVMLGWLTSDADVLACGMQYVPWLLLMPIVGCAAFTWDGIFTGATATRKLRNSMIWAVVAFLAVYFALDIMFNRGFDLMGLASDGTSDSGSLAPVHDGTLGLHLMLAAYLVHLVVRTVYLSAHYRKAVLSRL